MIDDKKPGNPIPTRPPPDRPQPTVERIAMVVRGVCSALIAMLSLTLNPGHCQRCGGSSSMTRCRACRRRREEHQNIGPLIDHNAIN